MRDIPLDILHPYGCVLAATGISPREQSDFRKWLRFYLDFCRKYRFTDGDRQALPHFLQKLEDKRQSEDQRRQASKAISSYYSVLDGAGVSHGVQEGNRQETTRRDSPAKEWENALHGLRNTINVKHYSPRTLEAYLHWARRFRRFLRDKPVPEVDSGDARRYLEFLAVQCRASASSRNQAFNALLFLYRNVLHKDYGDHSGTTRAKRTKHLPTVLTRAEVERLFANLVPPVSPSTPPPTHFATHLPPICSWVDVISAPSRKPWGTATCERQ